jgi:hypothetical protein
MVARHGSLTHTDHSDVPRDNSRPVPLDIQYNFFPILRVGETMTRETVPSFCLSSRCVNLMAHGNDNSKYLQILEPLLMYQVLV